MNIDRLLSGVPENHVFLDLADPEDSRLKHLFYEYALLWVHHLIVTLLQLSVDINILYVQASKVLEGLILWPLFVSLYIILD